MNFTRGFLLGALCVLLAAGSSLSLPTSTTSQPETYFGVPAADKEAVLAKQKELAMEQWRRMMGPSQDIEELDFTPDLSANGIIEQIIESFSRPLEALNNNNSQQ